MATLTSSTAQPQSYFMRFSSHSAALSRSLLGLLSESYCTDVHISTGHQSQTIRAHKIILSAFSPYFKSLFSSLPSNQFPVIIIREIQYDILRTIIEFCYRGEILVPRDKLDDIVSAAKFLQIEGAKDFVLPKHQQQSNSQQPGQQQNSTGTVAINANNRMQINLQQNNINQNIKQQQSLIALQHQQQQQKQMSLLSKLVQKPPILRGPASVLTATSNVTTTASAADHSMPVITGVRHINEKELNEDQREIKQELIDEEVLDEEEDDLEEGLDESITGDVGTESQKSGEKSGMFSEFEEQNNKSNNESNRQSDDSCAEVDDEPMDTGAQMGHILAKVPAGTSVSIGGNTSGVQQKNDNSNVQTHGSEEDLLEEEEEEYEDEFDEEEEECDSTNPLDLLNVNLSETEENPLSGADMSSATARAIAASTLASFGTNLDLDSEASQGSQFGGSQSLTISSVGGSERRGRGRPPKYEMGNVFSGQSPTGNTSSSAAPIVITAQSGQSPQHQSITITPTTDIASTSSSAQSSAQSSSAATRSRRGRPPSMPEELLRSLTGRLDKAHHKCPHCPQIYYGYHAMRDHITSVHLNSGEKYICNLCNKEYTWRITLRKHLKFHHGVHPDQVGNA